MEPAFRLHTLSDLEAIPDDGAKYELVAGWLLSEPPPGFQHGRIVARIVVRLASWVREYRLGEVVTGDVGFVLARDPDTVRAPDVAFVAADRVAAIVDPSRAFEGAPDLAVEVLSPSDTAAGIHGKVADYLSAGTHRVWVVDPARETVRVYAALLAPRTLAGRETLDATTVIPGFRLPLTDLFGN